MKKLCAALVLFSMSATSAFAYGPQGHQAIAALALKGLNKATAGHVQAILQNETLVGISTWPDDVREASKGRGPLVNDPEAMAFNRDFPTNGRWHFVDLPLDSVSYADPANAPFEDKDDVVHTIERCISVLEAPAPAEHDLTKRQALRVLVHLIGDLHQPFHAVSGYYTFDMQNVPALITDPAQAQNKISDRGGNELFFGPGNNQEMHALWDTGLTKLVAHSGSTPTLAAALGTFTTPARRLQWKTEGDYHKWAETWAQESVVAARAAYTDFTLDSAMFEGRGRLKRINITMAPDYNETHLELAETQLAKAAFHLSELLNSIKWI